MMVSIFTKLINISLSASILIVACILIRYAFKGMPKYMRCILWMLVLIHLVSPVRLESPFSLLPKKEIVNGVVEMDDPETEKQLKTIDLTLSGDKTLSKDNPAEKVHTVRYKTTSDKNLISKANLIKGSTAIWLIGIIISCIYGLFSYIRLRRCVEDAVLLKDNVYQSDRVLTPFVMGIIRPRIYIPFKLTKSEIFFVLSHERAHISRKDHLLKPVAYIISCIYWFNPLIWACYMLLCRDIELACDEKAINKIGYDRKKEYSQSILDLSVPGKYISACPVAFGETGVKERVKSVLDMKKGTKIAVVMSAVIIAVVGVGFLTYPKTKKNNETNKEVTTVEAKEEITKVAEKEESTTEVEEVKTSEEKEEANENKNENDTEKVKKITTIHVDDATDMAGLMLAYSSNDGKSLFLDPLPKINSVSDEGVETNIVLSFVSNEPINEEMAPEEAPEDSPEPATEKAYAYIEGGPMAGEEIVANLDENIVEDGEVEISDESVNHFMITREYSESHQGVDIAAEEGTNIHSYCAGTVKSAGFDEKNGNYIEVEDENGYVYSYFHLKDAPMLKAGDKVEAKQVIGAVGNTGESTGPHLHVEMTDKDGQKVGLKIIQVGSGIED